MTAWPSSFHFLSVVLKIELAECLSLNQSMVYFVVMDSKWLEEINKSCRKILILDDDYYNDQQLFGDVEFRWEEADLS